jgi:hypothetical protein
MRRFLPVRVDT